MDPRAPIGPAALAPLAFALLLAASLLAAPPARAVTEDAGVFQEPRVARRRPVVPPPAARRGGRRGKVMVRVLVDGNGRPLAPRVIYASVGPRRLHAALDSLREWQFDPASVDGVPVSFLTLVAVELGAR